MQTSLPLEYKFSKAFLNRILETKCGISMSKSTNETACVLGLRGPVAIGAPRSACV